MSSVERIIPIRVSLFEADFGILKMKPINRHQPGIRIGENPVSSELSRFEKGLPVFFTGTAAFTEWHASHIFSADETALFSRSHTLSTVKVVYIGESERRR